MVLVKRNTAQTNIGEEVNITLNERPEMTLEQIDREIAFQTAEMISYGSRVIYPNANKQIIQNAIANCQSKINQYNRLKKLRGVK